MASAVQSMRLCLRAAKRQTVVSTKLATTKITPRQRLTIRSFSSTRFHRHAASREDDTDEFERELDDDEPREPIDPAEMRRAIAKVRQDPDYEEAKQLQERIINSLGETFTESLRAPKSIDRLFWGEDESDPDLLIEETGTDEFDEDDMPSLAHAKFEEFREYREYARIAAWQMPLLSKLATPFEAPSAQEPLRFRYTSYMGELHPAESKVVVEFCPRDMPLNEAQQQKLRKLLGPRLNPETDIAKMSCEQFEHQAQNKRYLGDLVNKLIAQAKDPADTFEDVPLDTRHHTFKVKPKFPKEWRMTEERRLFLEESRRKALLLDQAKEEDGTLIDGRERINGFFNPQSTQVPETARVRVDEPLSPPQLGQRRPMVFR
ncbi:putative mitochondrial ribosomal small subunit component [Rosellinia necatrix]|uniref:Putative mitochondrial ribosomal small subunit component n=1 Tax=Rosellinia necatrix TaxID=77044 RepID=A0A1S7UJC3_ROSNE|nr:putative mitochondrial ribosomal small subunit component [Rosellinia necatrix]